MSISNQIILNYPFVVFLQCKLKGKILKLPFEEANTNF